MPEKYLSFRRLPRDALERICVENSAQSYHITSRLKAWIVSEIETTEIILAREGACGKSEPRMDVEVSLKFVPLI